MENNNNKIKAAHVEIHVLEAIPVEHIKELSSKQLIETVQNVITQKVNEIHLERTQMRK